MFYCTNIIIKNIPSYILFIKKVKSPQLLLGIIFLLLNFIIIFLYFEEDFSFIIFLFDFVYVSVCVYVCGFVSCVFCKYPHITNERNYAIKKDFH